MNQLRAAQIEHEETVGGRAATQLVTDLRARRDAVDASPAEPFE
ncbi:MAG: hypothetical protein ACYSVY_17870 [Planctomycetota bacterium]